MIVKWSPTPNHTTLTWGIWGIILSIFLLSLIISVGILYWKLYKDKKQLFTIKKVVFFATFLSISLILTFIESLIGTEFHISLDYIVPITVGFLYGPLEGIFFAWTADTLNVLIHGWSYSILSSTLLPMIGLISGIFGILYEKIKDNGKEILLSTIIVQLSIVFCLLTLISMLIVSIFTNLTLLDPNDKIIMYYMFFSISIILFILLETVYFYFLYKKDKKNLLLFSLVLVTTIISRTLGSVVTPFQGYFAGFSSNYLISLLSFILHSSYVIPLEALISYFFIKTALDFNVLY